MIRSPRFQKTLVGRTSSMSGIALAWQKQLRSRTTSLISITKTSSSLRSRRKLRLSLTRICESLSLATRWMNLWRSQRRTPLSSEWTMVLFCPSRSTRRITSMILLLLRSVGLASRWCISLSSKMSRKGRIDRQLLRSSERIEAFSRLKRRCMTSIQRGRSNHTRAQRSWTTLSEATTRQQLSLDLINLLSDQAMRFTTSTASRTETL